MGRSANLVEGVITPTAEPLDEFEGRAYQISSRIASLDTSTTGSFLQGPYE